MKTSYSHNKIHEILKRSSGQNKLAEQAIRTLIMRDHDFLLGLVEPFLSGIIAHAIERARKVPIEKVAPKPKPIVAEAAPEALPKKIIRKPGKKTEAAVLGNVLDHLAQQFSSEQAQKKPATASQAHVDTLRALAAKKTVDKV